VTDDWWEEKRTQLMQGLQQTQEWPNALSSHQGQAKI
jgi:hypothetical protein